MGKQCTINNWEIEERVNGDLTVTLFGDDHHYLDEVTLTERNISAQDKIEEIKHMFESGFDYKTPLLERIKEVVYRDVY